MLAQKIYENEKREREERKRKREEEEAWQRQGAHSHLFCSHRPTVNNVRLQESKRLDDEERQAQQVNRELYALFNDLQGISHAYGVPSPLKDLLNAHAASRTSPSTCLS